MQSQCSWSGAEVSTIASVTVLSISMPPLIIKGHSGLQDQLHGATLDCGLLLLAWKTITVQLRGRIAPASSSAGVVARIESHTVPVTERTAHNAADQLPVIGFLLGLWILRHIICLGFHFNILEPVLGQPSKRNQRQQWIPKIWKKPLEPRIHASLRS